MMFPNVPWKARPKKIITKYGLRRKSDGFYMPLPGGRGGRGGSHMEPVDPTNPFNQIRLFHSANAAKAALAQWCRGKHHHVVHEPISWRESPIPSDADEYVDIEHVPGRNKDDFDIVPIKVHLP